MNYQVREGKQIIPLTQEEARTLIRGEIPPVLAHTLAKRGLTFPSRGARALTLMVPHEQTEVSWWEENVCYARIARAA